MAGTSIDTTESNLYRRLLDALSDLFGVQPRILGGPRKGHPPPERRALDANVEEARHRLHALARLGIDLGRVVDELVDEGVMALERSYEEPFSTVAVAAGARRASRPAKPRVSAEQQEDTACAARSTSL